MKYLNIKHLAKHLTFIFTATPHSSDMNYYYYSHVAEDGAETKSVK